MHTKNLVMMIMIDYILYYQSYETQLWAFYNTHLTYSFLFLKRKDRSSACRITLTVETSKIRKKQLTVKIKKKE